MSQDPFFTLFAKIIARTRRSRSTKAFSIRIPPFSFEGAKTPSDAHAWPGGVRSGKKIAKASSSFETQRQTRRSGLRLLQADAAQVLGLLRVPTVSLGTASLGDRRAIGLLPPLVRLAVPGLGLHGANGLHHPVTPGRSGKTLIMAPESSRINPTLKIDRRIAKSEWKIARDV